MDEAEISDKVAIIDHGKIVAYDTPDNLKKQYTSSLMKIKVLDSKPVIQYLMDKGIKYKIVDELISIYIPELKEVFQLPRLSGHMPDSGLSGPLSTGRTALHFLSDHRAQGAGGSGIAGPDGQPDLWL